MGYRVEQIEPGIVVVNFFGSSNIGERFSALDEVNLLRDSNDRVGALIDMSGAEMRPYSAAQALALSDAVSRRPHASKVAYLLRPGQTDMIATAMAGLYGPSLFRRFDNGEAALSWLRE